MKKSELLPCPFCGAEVSKGRDMWTSGNGWYIECPACKARSGVAWDTGKVVAAWNTRAETVPPIDGLIDALRDGWNIEASWDGLRKFWCVGLTEEGVRKRDERDRVERDLRDEVNWMHAELHGAEMGRTCELDGTLYWDNGCTAYWEHELSCGHTVESLDNEPPSYCPDCGARVVS